MCANTAPVLIFSVGVKKTRQDPCCLKFQTLVELPAVLIMATSVSARQTASNGLPLGTLLNGAPPHQAESVARKYAALHPDDALAWCKLLTIVERN